MPWKGTGVISSHGYYEFGRYDAGFGALLRNSWISINGSEFWCQYIVIRLALRQMQGVAIKEICINSNPTEGFRSTTFIKLVQSFKTCCIVLDQTTKTRYNISFRYTLAYIQYADRSCHIYSSIIQVYARLLHNNLPVWRKSHHQIPSWHVKTATNANF